MLILRVISGAHSNAGSYRLTLRKFCSGALSSSAAVIFSVVAVLPASAGVCQYEMTEPLLGGVMPPLIVNESCTDPDFNEENFVIEEVTPGLLLPAPLTQIPYTRVKVHFSATKTDAELAAQGYTAGGPQTVDQPATFYFPPPENFQNRFFQHLYPLPQSTSNIPGQLLPNTASEISFALTSGGYLIDSEPANPLVGYRVDAAFAKMAREYAQSLYGNTGHIYGYIWGGSGGSYQVTGALEKTTGVWDGAVPYVIALSGLTSSGGMETRLYQMRVPAAKRAAISAAAEVGSGLDPFDGLTEDEKAGLLEYMRFGYPLPASPGFGIILFDEGRELDSTYEEDFWSVPGYAGKDFPTYVQAALVDIYVTITDIATNAQGQTVLTLDGAPTFGTTGSSGIEHYLYLADGTTRVRGATEAASVLAGTRDDTTHTFTVNPANDPALISALQVGARLRINNRYYIAVAHYPRHAVPESGANIQYDQYRDDDGKPIYPQRPVDATQPAGTRTSGGVVASGRIKFKTIVVTNQLDNAAFHLTGPAYAKMVETSLGERNAAKMFRIYQQESADHFDSLTIPPTSSQRLVSYVPVLYQAMRDLAAWVEHRTMAPWVKQGTRAHASTRYTVVNGQVLLAESAGARKGIQPVIDLTVDGGDRVEVAVNEPVNLTASIQAPPRTGRIVSFDWYFGGTPVAYEAETVLDKPLARVNVKRTITFDSPGTYFVSLRARSQRDGMVEDFATTLENLDRVRVVVY